MIQWSICFMIVLKPGTLLLKEAWSRHFCSNWQALRSLKAGSKLQPIRIVTKGAGDVKTAAQILARLTFSSGAAAGKRGSLLL